MPFLQGLRGKPREEPLVEKMRHVYGDGYHPLADLVVPFMEGDTTLSMPEFKNSIFTVDPAANRLTVFTDATHARDCAEARRDFEAHRHDLDERYRADMSEARKMLRESTKKRDAARQRFEDAFNDMSVSETRKNALESELDTLNRQIRVLDEKLGERKPRISSSMWLALSMNQPYHVNVGELGRLVGRLRDRELKLYGGVLPRRSECRFNDQIGVSVGWNR